jgi:hypothetical protein
VDLIGEGFAIGLPIAASLDSSLRAHKQRDVMLHSLRSPSLACRHGRLLYVD